MNSGSKYVFWKVASQDLTSLDLKLEKVKKFDSSTPVCQQLITTFLSQTINPHRPSQTWQNAPITVVNPTSALFLIKLMQSWKDKRTVVQSAWIKIAKVSVGFVSNVKSIVPMRCGSNTSMSLQIEITSLDSIFAAKELWPPHDLRMTSTWLPQHRFTELLLNKPVFSLSIINSSCNALTWSWVITK